MLLKIIPSMNKKNKAEHKPCYVSAISQYKQDLAGAKSWQ